MPFRLVALLAIAGAFPLAWADASLHAGASRATAAASLDFAIRVPRVLDLQVLDHPRVVEVTAEDVGRGEVRVRGARLRIVANHRDGWALRSELRGSAFAEMALEGLPQPVTADAAGATTVMPPMREARAMPVEYRLRLAEGTSPGRYAWPVALTLLDP